MFISKIFLIHMCIAAKFPQNLKNLHDFFIFICCTMLQFKHFFNNTMIIKAHIILFLCILHVSLFYLCLNSSIISVQFEKTYEVIFQICGLDVAPCLRTEKTVKRGLNSCAPKFTWEIEKTFLALHKFSCTYCVHCNTIVDSQTV